MVIAAGFHSSHSSALAFGSICCPLLRSHADIPKQNMLLTGGACLIYRKKIKKLALNPPPSLPLHMAAPGCEGESARRGLFLSFLQLSIKPKDITAMLTKLLCDIS